MNRVRTHSLQPRGITLTEILIALLILAVGVTSILTLFPLGILNARQANRYTRSGFLVQSADADYAVRNLMTKRSFTDNLVSAPWYTTPMAVRSIDVWLQDTPAYGADPWSNALGFGAYRGDGPPAVGPYNNTFGFIMGDGLPVAYDPLWRSTTGKYPNPATTPEYRFGSGIGFVRNDPDGTPPSAHGLQRITNFPAWTTANVPDIFVSPEDVVLQSDTDTSKGAGSFSPIVPDMTLYTNAATGMTTPVNDWKYTWMFTGQQTHVSDGVRFDGSVVVFENRPFAVNPVIAPFATTPAVKEVVAGETVVEAVYGHTNAVKSLGGTVGYGTSANRVVLLRWSNKVPDPEIRVGHWFADVTYERNATRDNKRRYLDAATEVVGRQGQFYPYQRCHWYQVAKRTQAGDSPTMPGFREMTVWTDHPLMSLTLLNVSDGTPVHVNAALISPYVVNVFPRTFVSH